MLHPVQQKVSTVNRLSRVLVAMYGLGMTVVLVVAVAFGLGLLDYLIRFEDLGVRFLSSFAVVAVLVWSVFRFANRALWYRPSNLRIAQQLEQRFPELNNGLSSSIEFLGQPEDSPEAGSADLRRAVVARTVGEIERLDFVQCLNIVRPLCVAAAAAGLCLVISVICCLDISLSVRARRQPSSVLAALRLAMPWADQPWPRRNVLEFTTSPDRIAMGADFDVELVDNNGRLPRTVEIHFWFDGDDQSEIKTKEMRFSDGGMVHREENVRRSFRYRASGGDDDSMEWISLEVIEPPQVESLEVRLYPPAYTGWPEEASGENIHAIEGTLVAADGRLSKPADALTLRTDGPETPEAVTVELSEGGLAFRLRHDSEPAWKIQQSGTYWFEATDPTGLRSRGDRRWNIRAVEDMPPTVSLEKPGANTFVTSDAVVPISAFVKDDLAIHTIVLRFSRNDSAKPDQLGAEECVEAYRGPDSAPRVPESGLRSEGERGESREFEYAWDLAVLEGLEPGQWVEFSIVASDYKPQESQSVPRRLTIISVDELEDRIAARQSYILGQLAEVLRVQRDTRSQTKSLEIALELTRRLDKKDVSQLESAELNQRQVGRMLSDPKDGVQTQIEALLHELASNRVDNPEVHRRMTELLEAVEQISREHVPLIQRELTGARKIARAQLDPAGDGGSSTGSKADDALAGPLGRAGSGQDEIITILERLLGELTEWDSYRRFAREISRIRQLQGEILQETEQTRLDTLGEELRDLDLQERANLKRLAERQTELARRFDKIQSRMDKMRIDLQDADPLAAETLADAVDLARRAAIGGQMHESARQVDQNRVGQAAETQKAIVSSLQELIDTLANRREHELDRRLRKMGEAADELKELRTKVKELQDKIDRAADQPDEQTRKRELQRLSREQEKLAEQAKRLARRLQRLQAEKSASLIEEASSQLDSAGEACEQGESKSALEEAQKAESTLEEAERELDKERRKAQQDLLDEQMARLEQQIGGLVARQQAIIDATLELDGLRAQQDGRLTRGQLASVGDLARQQRSLVADCAALAERIAKAKSFVLGLQGAMRAMDRAADGLDRADTGESTQQSERAAHTRLRQLQEALKRDNSQTDQPPSSKNPGGDGPKPPPPADAVQRLAELKLLKLMQMEINRRTMELEEIRRREGTLSEEQLDILKDLSAEQGRLADLAMDLTMPTEVKPEEDPENLPDASDDKPSVELEDNLDNELLEGIDGEL